MLTVFRENVLLHVIVLFAIVGVTITPKAFASERGATTEDPHADLNKAAYCYYFQDYDNATVLLVQIIEDTSEEEKTYFSAVVLLGRCYVQQGLEEYANNAFCRAVKTDPNWRPDPEEFPKEEIEVYDAVVEKCGGGTSPLVWIGGAVATIAAAIIFWPSGDKEEEVTTLQGFPDMP